MGQQATATSPSALTAQQRKGFVTLLVKVQKAVHQSEMEEQTKTYPGHQHQT